MDAILADFGQRTRQDDVAEAITVHFYETFLAAYDPALRERRGVYYTPTPVVSFIVRSVDALLKTKFGLPKGLADSRTIKTQRRRGAEACPEHSRRTQRELPKVLILDPATGTGTFLYSVIAHIRAQFMQGGNAGMWSGFVREHLLPRIFGFELLMAPYAVAHFKLAFQLAGHDLPEAQRVLWAYDFASDERIQVYLTNALEATEEEIAGLWGPLRIVTEEAQQANKVKQDYPIMVIIGNPPYAVSSSNKSDYIEDLMDRYKQAVRSERNIQPLSDDYIKFIRFAHDRIERTGHGILGFITNHSYLSGLIHRGMREELLKSFDELYILNLHGNALLGETAPDGGSDENVFDIRQGVAIALMVKTGEGKDLATVYYADLWGKRENKYRVLNENDMETLSWEKLELEAPYYFFVPKDFSLREEYEQGWRVTEIFGTGDFYADQGQAWGSGVKTNRDYLLVDFEKCVLEQRIRVLASSLDDQEVKAKFGIEDNTYWNTERERQKIRDADWQQNIVPYLYRPFDKRWLLYQPNLIEIKRGGASKYLMRHLRYENLALLTMRQVVGDPFRHVLVSTSINDMNVLTSHHVSQVTFPLYLYPENNGAMLFDNAAMTPWDPDPAHGNRVPNLAPAFVAEMEEKLGLTFAPLCHSERSEESRSFHYAQDDNAPGDTFGPRDILAYIYAVFHSPTYRERYAEFLKIDFPRVPLTSDADLFWQLVGLGGELIALHLLDLSGFERPDRSGVSFPVPGDNLVKARGGFPKFILAGESRTKTSDVAERNRVYINLEQYFAGVPEDVWAFEVGGYQVLHKWLKDRKGRVLLYADLEHYQRMVVGYHGCRALQETLRVMGEVDAAVGGWPVG
jgi:predicted helicase